MYLYQLRRFQINQTTLLQHLKMNFIAIFKYMYTYTVLICVICNHIMIIVDDAFGTFCQCR